MTWYLIDHPPATRQYRARSETPSGVIVVHTAENAPDVTGADGSAEAVARFIAGRREPGSYHVMADSDSIVPLVPPHLAAFHDGSGSNPHSWGVSGATQAHRWHTPPTAHERAMVANMARAAAEYARWIHRVHGVSIPARRITRAESEARRPGFISHAERSQTGNRTDPGAGFPWALFLAGFASGTGTPPGNRPPTALPPEDDDMPLSDDDIKRIARAVWVYPVEVPENESTPNDTVTARGALKAIWRRAKQGTASSG